MGLVQLDQEVVAACHKICVGKVHHNHKSKTSGKTIYLYDFLTMTDGCSAMRIEVRTPNKYMMMMIIIIIIIFLQGSGQRPVPIQNFNF